MLRFIKNNLLWSQTFDEAYRRGDTFFNRYNDRSMQEKRFHWRERLGRLGGYTPEEAAFRAYEDFADDYYARNKDRCDAESHFQEIAYALEFAAPYTDRKGSYKERRTFLSDRWLSYLQQYEERRNVERAEQKERTDQVMSFRFNPDEIKAAWDKLLEGKVPWEAKSVFRGAHPRRTPHEIAKTMIVPMREVMFWLVVFRNHGIVTESFITDKHLYVSHYVDTDPETLSEPLKTVVRQLQ